MVSRVKVKPKRRALANPKATKVKVSKPTPVLKKVSPTTTGIPGKSPKLEPGTTIKPKAPLTHGGKLQILGNSQPEEAWITQVTRPP